MTQAKTSTTKPAAKKPPKAVNKPPLADRVFALLLGNWMIERDIRPKGSFSGTASFLSTGDATMAYAEEGTLTLNDGATMLGERRHTYRLHEDGIEVLFADGPNTGEHFVDILFPSDPEADWPLCSGDTHYCLKDTYKAMFCFDTEDEFSITYTVCGPEKDYVSHSVYRRIKPLG
ncbi:DUF6314 family protein [Oleispirillum naphthae]|uniref:DUF6314 family protein n=1 Tax=Oleispirillum naphthae TaxID=2838853 RepID=UPI0030823C1C